MYPNGPNPSNPKIVNGEQQYYDKEKTSKIVLGEYGQEFHEGKKSGDVVLFYWNEDESARYYYDDTNKCWSCMGDVTISEDYRS